MSLEADLKTTLSASVFSGRFYAQNAPVNVVPPYAVFQIISQVPEEMIDGATPNLLNSRVQVNIFDRELATIIALVVTARAAMTAATLFKCTSSNVLDASDDLALFYGKQIDFSVWHYE